MSKRYTGEWRYVCMFHEDGQVTAHREWMPLGYSQSHWRKIKKSKGWDMSGMAGKPYDNAIPTGKMCGDRFSA